MIRRIMMLAFLVASGCPASSNSRSDLCVAGTPGIVQCGGSACRVELCLTCADGGAGSPVCYPDGGAPQGCSGSVQCDGPEDCPAGTACWEEEFGVSCATQGFDQFSHQLCHSDCDCPASQPHCVSGKCGCRNNGDCLTGQTCMPSALCR